MFSQVLPPCKKHFWAWLRLSNLKRCASILAELLIPLQPTGHLRLAPSHFHYNHHNTTTLQHVRTYLHFHTPSGREYVLFKCCRTMWTSVELRPLRILKLIRTSLVWIHGQRAVFCRKLPSAKTCWPHGLNFENRIES